MAPAPVSYTHLDVYKRQPLDLLLLVDGHVVPQVVKAHLVVGAVGDVGGVGILALLSGEAVDDEA